MIPSTYQPASVLHPLLIQAVATGLPMLLLPFAAIARNDPDSFGEMINRTGALHLTLTVSPLSASVTSLLAATWRASSR
jgi:hypothetical protein